MTALALLLPAVALAVGPPAAGAAAPAAPSAHPKRCSVIAHGSRDLRVRARVVGCRFAVRWSRAYLRSRARPRGYSCSRPGGSIALYCRKGDRTYWAERLGAAARAAHPGHGPGQVLIGAGTYSPRTIRVATGDRVLWFWNGPDVNHTVTAEPGQAEAFDSDPGGIPLHQRNHVYSHDFTQAGSFRYFCRVHPETMQGVVEVVAPPPGDVTRPVLSRVRASSTTGRLRFTVSEPATVLVRVERRRKSRWRARRDFDVAAKRGQNRARMPLRGLGAGAYRARLVAYDDADNASREAIVRFRLATSA